MRRLRTSVLLVPICCLLLLLMGCTGSQTNADQGTSQSGGQETTAPAATAQGHWSEVAALPVGRSEIAVTQTDEAMYVLGGVTPETKSSTLVTSYDPRSDAWQELAPLPKGLNHVAASAAVGGKVYSFGGFTQQNRGAVDSAYEYDPQSDTWTELPPMPAPRGAAAAVALDGRLHVIGGADDVSTGSRENVGTHEVYDPATGQWSEAAPLPTPREHMPAVVYEGKIHVIGGRFLQPTNNTATHEVYDPKSDSWKEVAPLPTPRSGTAGAVLDDKILVMGGEMNPDSSTGTFVEENEAYDPVTDSWSTLTPLPTPRHGFGAAVFGGAVYTPGGAPTNGGSQQSDVNEVFTF